MTRATELTDVGQGLACGCLARGVVGVTSDPMALEMAFRHAWRAWSQSRSFKHVRAGFDRNDVRAILYRSEGRRGSFLAFWEPDGPWQSPVLRDLVSLDDAANLMPTYSGIAWSDWLELADLFVGEFKPNQLAREK